MSPQGAVFLDGVLVHLLNEVLFAIEKANRPPQPAHSVRCPTIYFDRLMNGIRLLKEDEEWSTLLDTVIIPMEQW